jgi:hypothetical protein
MTLHLSHAELEEQFELTLDALESLNQMWSWHSIHRNDEGEFRSVQALLKMHGRRSQVCAY